MINRVRAFTGCCQRRQTASFTRSATRPNVFHLDWVMRKRSTMPSHGVVKPNQGTTSSTDVPATLDGERAASQAAQVDHPTMSERAAKGKAQRRLVPLSAHGEWQPSADRRDPVSLLEEQAATRGPEL